MRNFCASPEIVIPILQIVPIHVELAIVGIPVHVRHVTIAVARASFYLILSTAPKLFYLKKFLSSPRTHLDLFLWHLNTKKSTLKPDRQFLALANCYRSLQIYVLGQFISHINFKILFWIKKGQFGANPNWPKATRTKEKGYETAARARRLPSRPRRAYQPT